jgi:flavin reductase (DIM6/NTAB) family NADH-FMN oxidoreductase RutF
MKNAPFARFKDETEVVDSKTFRAVLGQFVTGVTVITARGTDATAVGVTVSSFNTLSLAPPLILWSISLDAPSLKLFRSSNRFAVNILAQDQTAIAKQFARPAANKFHAIETTEGLSSVPLIAGAAAHLECVVEQRYPGGDHELIIGRVLRATKGHLPPLVYGYGKFGNFLISPDEGPTKS